MTTFVINIRYNAHVPVPGTAAGEGNGDPFQNGLWLWDHRRNLCHGVPKPGILRAPYLFGLILFPILGWNLGTVLGGSISAVLPEALQNAMGIALYGMFIALIVPASRDSIHIFLIVVMAVAANCMLKYIPVFSFISPGFRIILSTVAGAGLGAALFPRDEAEYVKKEGETE